MAPVRAVLRVNPAFSIRCVASVRYTMPSTRPMIAGRLANRKRNGYEKLSTHWRTGCSGTLHPPAGWRSRQLLLYCSTSCIPALVGHAPRPATGVIATALVTWRNHECRGRRDAQERPTEGDQVFSMTAIATYPQETLLEAPAVEVILELPLDIARQFRALGRQMRLERGIVSWTSG
jgi:hypothetical protein